MKIFVMPYFIRIFILLLYNCKPLFKFQFHSLMFKNFFDHITCMNFSCIYESARINKNVNDIYLCKDKKVDDRAGFSCTAITNVS